MSVATVENKTGKRPQYKDYVSFLENYKNGKKDDQASDSGVSFSLNNSSNNSSSSIYSDLSETPKNNFKEYLENYNNKKFSSVLPPRAVTKTHEETKTVKTEVFIEINNTNTPTTVSKVVEINNVSNVSKVSKIFENNPGNVIAKTVPPSGKVNTFNFEQRNHKKPDTVNPHKIQLRKSNSISEKSRVFEDSNHEADMRKNGVAKLNGCVSPKPSLKPITVPKAATTEHGAVSPKPNGALSPKPPLNIKPLILPKAVTETLVMQQKENETITPETKEVAPKFTPPPPPLPQETGPCSIPPPPPPPPANFVAPKPNEVTSPPKPRVTSVPKPNGVAPAPKHDVVDGTMRISSKPTTDSNTIDKNDPRVKKLVYGALRGMYGAYHDKANDYIATLPRNRVKKNNGLDSIINSIAQQSQLLGTGPGFGPPPPHLSTGQHIDALNLETLVYPRTMDPPQCVQNAMMTKDKKPFTYTPGGIDLSEVRSPRMQRRIERNANLGGAGDVPKPQPPPPQNMGPLPPSVQAAMRPQPQVQVFPSGPPPPPPMARGGAPPPPPPFSAPPPPPPPTGPLPTQKVMMADNQVLERPDMTKIIPDNPMAMLRKTGGPAPRRSIVDEIFAQEGKAAPAPVTPPSGQRPYQPPVVDRGAPVSPVPQHLPQSQPQQYQPPKQQFQPQQQYQPPQQQYQPPQPQQWSPEAAKEPPRFQPPVIERQQTLPRQNNVQPEVKTSTAHLGSLYIPPVNQQQQQKRIVSPPSPPERNTDSPGLQTPPLREAPRPWQAKKTQQEEIPPWARREDQERPVAQNVQQSQSPPTQPQQQRWPQTRPVQQQQQQQQQQQPAQQYNQQSQPLQQPAGVPVRIIIRTNTGPAPYQQPQQQEPEAKVEAVYVTQPVVLQHPGPRIPGKQQQAPQQRVDNQPVDGSQTPTTPGSNRSLNRQQSWGNNPTQSNTFKIIQKITQTEDDDEDENVPITEHGPRYPQNFQQPPADQMRRMKLNEGDQNLMNKFKQVVDDENYQREVDPRYRGPAIPSKAFKFLQNMTEGSPDPSLYPSQAVPSGPQPQRKGPQVRTIPIQIENDDPPQPYVHPSEQVVPEPKKYTGSSIPSRSFKILQAMTAPDNCASNDDRYEATPYEHWGYDPNYPPYPPPPYWHDYYHYYYQEPQLGLSKEETASINGRATPINGRTTPRQTPTPRHTPVPFWNYMPPYPYPSRRATTVEPESDAETNPRSTPLPFWGETQGYPQYPAYYDPYYYPYYYGYPPMYPPYPYYPPSSDTDDFAGYSSTDEMSYYNNQKPRRRNSFSGIRATTPKIPKRAVTPTLFVRETVLNSKNDTEKPLDLDLDINTSESDSDTETEEDTRRNSVDSPLKSIKSVNNIHLYADDEVDSQSHCSDDEVGIEEYVEEDDEDVDEEGSVYIVDDETYPHQLSVIYEESERTDSRIRSASALSDSTTIAERSDDEDMSPNVANVNAPFKFSVSVTEEEKEAIKAMVSIGDREIKAFEDTLKNPVIPMEDLVDIKVENSDDEDEETQDSDEDDDKKSDESEDWWGIIGKEDDLPAPRPILKRKSDVYDESSSEEVKLDPGDEQKEEPIHTPTDTNPEEMVIEEVAKPKNNYARAKSVYDKIEDESEEESNNGKLIEMESFVETLERIQRESGLWNIQLPRKIRDNPKTMTTEQGRNRATNGNVGEDDSSTSYRNYNCSKSWSKGNEETTPVSASKNEAGTKKPFDSRKASEEVTESDETSEELDSSEDESEESDQQKENHSNNEAKPMSIQERIQALKETIRQKQSKLQIQEQEPKTCVKEKVSAIETNGQNRSKTTSTKSSVKSFEEYSEEEEGDSGVTSDMSRHISDTEEFPELKKLTKYQRAATHSRLFKLLQDECDDEEIQEETSDKFSSLSVRRNDAPKAEPPRRDQLSLPLKMNENESLCSSGITSPGSPVNEKLINELVQSLLKRKKGQVFRNMPKDKLFAAAARILQEDLEGLDLSSEDCSSFLSPLRGSTGSSTAAQTPQEFNSNYDEYKQYYESWSEAERLYDENYDILPSKAFKLLQEHSNLSKTGTIAGLLAKCPRVLSSKNIHKLVKLLESPDSPSPTPEKSLETNEVTSAS